MSHGKRLYRLDEPDCYRSAYQGRTAGRKLERSGGPGGLRPVLRQDRVPDKASEVALARLHHLIESSSAPGTYRCALCGVYTNRKSCDDRHIRNSAKDLYERHDPKDWRGACATYENMRMKSSRSRSPLARF